MLSNDKQTPNGFFIVIIKFIVKKISRCGIGNSFEIWIMPENAGQIISILCQHTICVCVCRKKEIQHMLLLFQF